MPSPWIRSARYDGLWIIGPPIWACCIVLIAQPWVAELESQWEMTNWLIWVIGIDVAHVYATLFKTYWRSEERKRWGWTLYIYPLLAFAFGVVLFQWGPLMFWRVMAYMAAFHFIRQQYGMMRLYTPQNTSKRQKKWDKIAIYTATLYPMTYWFLSPKRAFNWFVANDFYCISKPQWLAIGTGLYGLILGAYLLQNVYYGLKNRPWNGPKMGIVWGTALSWYISIVYFNSDWSFTVVNVISHGVPYMALVYAKSVSTSKKKPNIFGIQEKWSAVLFVTILWSLALIEEWFWDLSVWHEHFAPIHQIPWSSIEAWWVPLLTVPQLTHYWLDGIIWKRPKPNIRHKASD